MHASADGAEVFKGGLGDDLRPLNGIRGTVPVVGAQRYDDPSNQGLGDKGAVRGRDVVPVVGGPKRRQDRVPHRGWGGRNLGRVGAPRVLK